MAQADDKTINGIRNVSERCRGLPARAPVAAVVRTNTMQEFRAKHGRPLKARMRSWRGLMVNEKRFPMRHISDSESILRITAHNAWSRILYAWRIGPVVALRHRHRFQRWTGSRNLLCWCGGVKIPNGVIAR